MRIEFLLCLLLLMFIHPVYPQLDSIQSVEIPIKYNEYPFYVLPAGENGLLLYRPKYKDNMDRYYQFEFYFYDQNLKLRWTSLLRLEYMFDVIEHTYSNGYLYIMFSGVKSFKKRLMVHRVYIPTQSSETFEINTFFPDAISYFKIFKNTIVIGGREKSKPSIVFYHLDEKRPVILQGFYEKNILIYDIQIDEENELFTVLTGFSGKNQQGSLNIRSFDEFGQPVEDIRIETEDDRLPMDSKSIIANHSYRLVAGIYKSKKTFYPAGIFMNSLHLDGSREGKYYPFKDIFDQADSINGTNLNEQNIYVSNTVFDRDRLHWHITYLNEFQEKNVILLESFTTEKGSSSFMDKSVVYYFQQALMIVFDDRLIIDGIVKFDLSPLQSERMNPNVQIRNYDDSLKLTLFDGYRIAKKVIMTDFRDKPLTYFHLENGQVRNPGNSNAEDPAINFQPWFENYYLLLQIKSVEEQEIQQKFIVRKIYYP